MSFRLVTIFYIFALLAAAMATFGTGGIAIFAAVVAAWSWVLSGRKSLRVRWLQLLVAIAIMSFIVALLAPAINAARQAALRNQCQGNMAWNSTAIEIYHELNGSLPANVLDAEGTPMLSWRVLLLPHMESPVLFNRVALSKAWDHPKNRPWSSTKIDSWNCPGHHHQAPITDYFAVVGPHAVWPESGKRSLNEITDGPASTIMLIEVVGRQISWAEPHDLTFDAAVDLLTQEPDSQDGHWISNGFFYKKSRGRNVAFADGTTAFLVTPLTRELATALLTIDGREPIDESELERAQSPQLDYAKCYGVAVFVLLALLPAARLRRKHASHRLPADSQLGPTVEMAKNSC